ncbi:DUF2865 domain-containing protein [Tianweitania sediminis]|uniref:DUF2865 domain-containing protein n=1 Tax=Tianweitania sediminis TaxID=1502156 RepID=A0A8J7RPQ6_9HYPH|nr:DUF2865 domain-containing protein [Tianweitania sediminis]MBP0439749.1 DUF2865 domain-containing protein [Tianweitania sediminis]
MMHRSWSWRGAGAAALVLAALASSPSAAQAASSQLCRQLEADLVAANRGAGATNQIRRYDRALDSQERQIAIAEADWQQMGCGYRPRDGADDLCLSIEDSLDRMHENLNQLSRERAQLDGGGNARADRRRIQREIDEAGCREQAALPQEAAVPQPAPAAPSSQKLRTMCVRTCDGYFFPLSYGVTKEEFGRDARSCQASCPSTEMRLYYHSVPDQEASAMVSADGDQPYSALPTANLYRNENSSAPGSCGCAPATGSGAITAVAPPHPAPSAIQPETQTTSPSFQVLPDDSLPRGNQTAAVPAPKAEPTVIAPPPKEETAPQALPPPPEPPKPRTMSDAERNVRVVGPTFLPDREEAIDLRAPGRKTDP